jgi:hypothetical protein
LSKDGGTALGLLVLAGLYWLGADRIKVSRLEGIVGAQAVPKGLALSLALLSLILLAQDRWRARRTAAAGGASDHGGHQAELHALGMLLIGIAYLAVVGTIGYLPAVLLLILATARYVGRPWSLELLAVAAAGAVLYYLMFVRLLGIPLPPGLWPALVG